VYAISHIEGPWVIVNAGPQKSVVTGAQVTSYVVAVGFTPITDASYDPESPYGLINDTSIACRYRYPLFT
jgi:hypothetical protein